MPILIYPKKSAGRDVVRYGKAPPTRDEVLEAQLSLRLEGDVLKEYPEGSRRAIFVRHENPEEWRKEFLEDLDKFEAWRAEVDCAYALDTFDLALGWFSGRGYSVDDALAAAERVRDCEP